MYGLEKPTLKLRAGTAEQPVTKKEKKKYSAPSSLMVPSPLWTSTHTVSNSKLHS